MAYKTEIQVKVNGVAQLKDLETTLTRVNALQTRINKRAATKLVNIGRLNSETQALNSLNKALERNVELQGKLATARNTQAANVTGATGQSGSRGAASQGRGLGPALVGGAFPLLFGGGPGAVAGGFIGELAGPLGGVVGSAVGMQFDALAQKAVDLGKALNPLSADFDTLIERLGAVNTPLESVIRSYEELEEEQKALELATQQLARLVGSEGVQALEEFGKGMLRVESAFSKLLTQMLAFLAEAANQLPKVFAENIERAVLLGQAEKSTDPVIQGLVQQREAARGGSLSTGFDKGLAGFLQGGDPGEFDRLTEEIIKKQRESNQLSFDQLTILDKSLAKRLEERDLRTQELKEARERNNQRITGLRVQQAGVQIQLNQLGNEQKIFGIRQQAATAGLRLEEARFNAELSTFQLQETRLKRELETLQKKGVAFNKQLRLIDKIAENQAKQARIEFEVARLRIRQNIEQAKSARVQISFEIRRIKLQIQMARLKALEEEDDKRRAARLKEVNSAGALANELAGEMAKAADVQLQTAIKIGNEQEKIARNVLKGKLESIEAERVEARRAVQMKAIAAAAGKAADETSRMNGSGGSGGGGGGILGRGVRTQSATTRLKIDSDVKASVERNAPGLGYRNVFELVEALDRAQESKNRRLAAQKRNAQLQQQQNAMFRPLTPSAGAYSARQVVARPVQARQIQPVNVTTGPVMQFDNEKYVSMQDFESVINELSRSQASSSRSYAGRTYGGVG